MNYRIAEVNDADKLDELLEKLIIDEKEKYDSSIESTDVTDFYKNYIGKEDRQMFVCVCDDEIVGYIYVIIESKNKAKIDALFVEDKYRKQGIGLKLIELAKEWIKGKNIENVDINLMTENVAAKNTYAKAGFITYKETMKLKI